MSKILSPDIEQLAGRVAAHSGKTVEQILRNGVEMQALMAGMDLGPISAGRHVDVSRARQIARRVAARPLLDPRHPRDILEKAWALPDDRHR